MSAGTRSCVKVCTYLLLAHARVVSCAQTLFTKSPALLQVMKILQDLQEYSEKEPQRDLREGRNAAYLYLIAKLHRHVRVSAGA